MKLPAALSAASALLLAPTAAARQTPAASTAAMPPALAAAVNAAVEEAKLTASEGESGDSLGFAAALWGDTAVVGAYTDTSAAGGGNAGSAYVFVRSGTTWTQQAKLLPSDLGSGDQFGYAVAIDGDTVLVGAHLDDNPGGADAGSAYVFVRSGSTWTQQAKLRASDAAPGDEFGGGVTVQGDTAAVGAAFDSHAGGPQAGSAYVFTRAGSTWTEQQKLVASPATPSVYLGEQLSLDGDTLLASSEGAAYVFTGSGSTWSQQAELVPTGGSASNGFGVKVCLSGDTAIVGALYDDHAGGVAAGAAYVFVRSGTSWSEQQKLVASDASSGDLFGASVAVSGDVAVASALFDAPFGLSQAGSAYVFERSGGVWTEQEKLVSSDIAATDFFGGSVAVQGDTVLIGATLDDQPGKMDAGSAYVFRLLDCGASAPASEVVRLGTPPNPAALLPGQTSGPVLGKTWDPRVDHASFVPGALVDVLALALVPANFPSPIGTILFDPSTPPFLVTHAAGLPFAFPIPADCGLVGSTAVAQAGSADAAAQIALTNALDVAIGTF